MQVSSNSKEKDDDGNWKIGNYYTYNDGKSEEILYLLSLTNKEAKCISVKTGDAVDIPIKELGCLNKQSSKRFKEKFDQSLYVEAVEEMMNVLNNAASESNTSVKKPFAHSVGDIIICPYNGDFEFYYAKIKSINKEANKCQVVFLYYENEEVHPLNDILDLSRSNMELVKDECCIDEFKKANHSPKKKYESGEHKSKARPADHSLPPLVPTGLPMMPPMPNDLAEKLKLPSNENEALKQMLISWYTCGYYSGFHHGRYGCGSGKS